jgi:uncharacterized sulfatase
MDNIKKLKRRDFITTASLAFTGIAMSQSDILAKNKANKRPNIILILTDDHGYADIELKNLHKDLKTPNVNYLMKNGAHCPEGYCTAPQCVPSRAGVIAGQYQNKLNVEENSAYKNDKKGKTGIEVPNFEMWNNTKKWPQYMQSAGYVTGMAGKWHLGENETIKKAGFDYVYHKSGKGDAWANMDLQGNRIEEGTHPTEEYHLDACSKACVSFIKKNYQKPFMYYLAYRAPHTPMDAPKKYLDRFPGKMPERRRHALGMMSAMDDGVGEILKTLRSKKIEENTLIFYVGDNGAILSYLRDRPITDRGGWDGSYNTPLNGEKGMLTEGGIRTPWLAYWKGTIPANTTFKHPVISLDVAATAVSLAGIKKPTSMDGVNLIPYLSGEKKGAPHEALYWRWIGQTAIRMGEYKYLSYKRADKLMEFLFDVVKDKEEKNNLIDQHPKIVASLKKELNRWSQTLTPPGMHQVLSKRDRFYVQYMGVEPDPNAPQKKKRRKKK